MDAAHPNTETNRRRELRRPPMDDVFVMPMSLTQQRFWLLDQLEPGNTSLNMPLALDLSGKLDADVLEKALNEIVSRHEILRTNFLSRNGNPVQVIAPELFVPLEEVDVSDCINPRDEANRLMIEEAHTVFDLERGRLFKTKLVRLGADEHILLLTLHHIICDGWSNGVLVREIGEIYDAFRRGRPSPCEEMPIQYADFAVWQKNWLNSDGFQEQLDYWKQQLGNELPALEIPTDFPRSKNRSSFGAIESLLLPRALTRAIKALGQREDATPFMIFLAAFNVLLHRYSGQDAILIGSPTANRIQSETEALIGPFANTLLLKSDLSGDPSFKEMLRRVKDISLGAFSNQSVPFEKLLESIRTAPGRNRSQLFPILFIFQTAFMKPVEVLGLSITPIRSVSPGSIFELSLGVVERSEGTRLQMEYNTDLFRQDTVKCMLEDLQGIFQSAVLDSTRSISSLLEWTTPLRARTDQKANVPLEPVGPPATAVAPGAAANDLIEEVLRSIWKDVLALDSVGLQDDFFELGGHSLLAAQLFDNIAKRLGANLTLATLFKASTIEQLAKLIREERPREKWTSLVPINANGSKTPFFLMHAAGGNVLFYKDLANRLGPDQPCYGMQAVGLDGHQSAYDRIEDMAAHYIMEIRGVQPKGPYYLGGSSIGGLIAYEIGMQLRKSGEEVNLIALFDTYAPGYPVPVPTSSKLGTRILTLADRIQHHADTLRLLESGRRWPYVLAKAIKVRNAIRRSYKQTTRRLKRSYLRNLGRQMPDALVTTQNAISVATRRYKPLPYNGNLLLFRATKQIRGMYSDDTLGWSSFAEGKLEIHEVNGSHGTIVAEPRVRFVVPILQRALNRAESQGSDLQDAEG